MATLSEMRAKIRVLLDQDSSSAGSLTWSDAQINDAIKLGQAQVALAFTGRRNIVSTVTVTLTNGIATVPANSRIINAFWTDGSVLVPLYRGTGAERSLPNQFQASGRLVVEYIAKNIFPATDSDVVTYAGVDLQDDISDTYCAYWAAATLSTTLGETNKNLSAMLSELAASIKLQNSPTITVSSGSAIYRQNSILVSKYFESGPSNTTITIYR